MGYEFAIDASKNEKSHGGLEGGEKYSSSYSTAYRLWQAERTGTAAQVRGTCRNRILSQVPVV